MSIQAKRKRGRAASKIVLFPGASIPCLEPSKDVVEILESALKQAKDGNIVAIGIVTVQRQPRAFEIRYHAENGTPHNLIAGVLCLQHRIAAALSESE